MIPAALSMEHLYSSLELPLMVLAGEGDKIVKTRAQSVRLHEEVSGSILTLLPGVGHMMHYADPVLVAQAVETLAETGPSWIKKEATTSPGIVETPSGVKVLKARPPLWNNPALCPARGDKENLRHIGFVETIGQCRILNANRVTALLFVLFTRNNQSRSV